MAVTLGALVFTILGAAAMILAAVEYHKLLNYYKREVYAAFRTGYYLNLILLYVFIFGFVIALVDILLRRADIRQLLVSLAFFLSALYILFLIKNQASAAVMLREKTLEAIRAFVNTIDLKDFCTQGHSKQVYDIVNVFCDYLGSYRYVLNREKLLDAAILHDIGKINLSAEILSKREPLSAGEWELIKSHPRRGKEMLDATCFSEISDWILYHHERVDGNGYYGLASEDIPLESKIIAIADTYSALCTDRAYRPRVSHDEAMEVIAREMGKQFDRKLAACFLSIDRAALESL
jgi:HD-GYP domain-containing protein (c-di-GMP phosphodiesterase class II)